jgi:hypothetical protein
MGTLLVLDREPSTSGVSASIFADFTVAGLINNNPRSSFDSTSSIPLPHAAKLAKLRR